MKSYVPQWDTEEQCYVHCMIFSAGVGKYFYFLFSLFQHLYFRLHNILLSIVNTSSILKFCSI